MRVKAILICSECLSRNYVITRNKENTSRFEMIKFCKKCNKHTLHKESK